MYTCAHAAIKYRFKVLSLCPGAVIPHITALHTQGPHCSDYREETYNPIHLTLLCCVYLCIECCPCGSVCIYIPVEIYEHCSSHLTFILLYSLVAIVSCSEH